MANGLKSRLEDLKESFDRMSARERRMVGALAAVACLLVVGGIGYWVYSSLDEIETHNTAIRQALKDIGLYKDRYLANDRRRAALNLAIPKTALELNTYVETAAKAVGVKIDESSETQSVPGSRYIQRGLHIKVRRLNISQLASLLKRLEGSSGHVVQVTELSARTRWRRHEEVDVELVVTTYERADKKAPKKRTRRTKRGRRG